MLLKVWLVYKQSGRANEMFTQLMAGFWSGISARSILVGSDTQGEDHEV